VRRSEAAERKLEGSLEHKDVLELGGGDIIGIAMFGSTLHKALFVDAAEAGDIQLPGAAAEADTPARAPVPSSAPAAAPVVAALVEPAEPTCPPSLPPRLVDVKITRPAGTGGPLGPNKCPELGQTPRADAVRRELFLRHEEDVRLLCRYQEAYKSWAEHIARLKKSNSIPVDGLFSPDGSVPVPSPSTTTPPLDEEGQKLKREAIDAQMAYLRNHQAFEAWKASCPAVAVIYDSIQREMELVQSGARFENKQRKAIVEEVKDEKERQASLAQFDQMAALMRESREHDLWRRRVEAMMGAETMLVEAENRAVKECHKTEKENQRAEEEARKKEEEEEEEACRHAEEEARRKAEEEERHRAQEACKKAEEEARGHAKEEARKKAEEEDAAAREHARLEEQQRAAQAEALANDTRAAAFDDLNGDFEDLGF